MERNARLKKRIGAWKTAFSDETNGVFPTLQKLYWNYAAFRTAIAIMRYASAHPEKDLEPNSLLLDMVADAFWQGTLLGVRRLLEHGDLSSHVGVHSLRSIIRDVEANRMRITRRVYVEDIAGLPYDYETLERQEYETLAALPAGTARWGSTDAFVSRLRHEQFDFLSGVAPANRAANDKIKSEVFDKLERRLAELDSISTLR